MYHQVKKTGDEVHSKERCISFFYSQCWSSKSICQTYCFISPLHEDSHRLKSKIFYNIYYSFFISDFFLLFM